MNTRTIALLLASLALPQCGGVSVPEGSTCTRLADCVLGQVCLEGSCVATSELCGGTVRCLDSEVCSGGRCIEAACASVSCPTGEQCQAGSCIACLGGPSELVCSDGLDDDCDLAPDCADEDCAGQSCGQGKLCEFRECRESACADGVQEGNESDVDCGGSCSPCPDGKKCGRVEDCVSGVCDEAGLCVPVPAVG